MKRSGRKIIVALLLVTMLSQTLYSAAASVFGLGTRSYAYADDEYTDDVEPGEEVDESTQDDSDSVQKAPSEETDEETTEASDEESGDGDSDEPVESDNNDNEKEAVDIRLRVSYIDGSSGSAIKDTEDLTIDTGLIYLLKDEAPEIEDYSYSRTTINIEDEEYDITAILTEDLDGTEIYSITTDK